MYSGGPGTVADGALCQILGEAEWRRACRGGCEDCDTNKMIWRIHGVLTVGILSIISRCLYRFVHQSSSQDVVNRD